MSATLGYIQTLTSTSHLRSYDWNQTFGFPFDQCRVYTGFPRYEGIVRLVTANPVEGQSRRDCGVEITGFVPKGNGVRMEKAAAEWKTTLAGQAS